MLHRYRVPLFVSQSFLSSSDALAHSCASHPLSCKCSAHPGLSSTITARTVHQVWPCLQVWCYSIHPKGMEQIIHLPYSLKNCPLIGCTCQRPLKLPISHDLASSWNSTLQVHVIISLLGTHPVIQSSKHASLNWQYKGSWLYVQCSSQ